MVSERMKAITNGVMSVELAMRREIAYRHKMAELETELLQQSNIEKDYSPVPPPMTDAANQIQAMPSQVPIQGEFPTPTPKPYSGPPIHSRPPHYQPAPTQPMPTSGPMPSSRPSVNPYSSPQQMPRTCSTQTQIGMKRAEPSSGLQQLHQFQSQSYCKTCRIDCQTPYNLHMHLKGSKHKARIAMKSHGKKPYNAEAAGRSMHCELCDVWCGNWQCWKQHIEGKNHLVKKQKRIVSYRESCQAS